MTNVNFSHELNVKLNKSLTWFPYEIFQNKIFQKIYTIELNSSKLLLIFKTA